MLIFVMLDEAADRVRLSDLLFCVDTNSLHLLKRLGQALHIVDIDFIIYESDTWSNPQYMNESSGAEDRLEASGSALGHVDKVLITTCLGSRGLEKKIVVYISPENMGDFLAIVKEKNFIEVVSRSINQVGRPGQCRSFGETCKYSPQGRHHHRGRPQGRKSQPRETP